MRKIFFAIIGMLVIATFFSCTTSRFSSYTPVESNELLFSETYDEFKGTITWIRHNYFLSNSGERPFYLYIGIHKDGVMLRGVFTYRGRGWINFSRVVMTNTNGYEMQWHGSLLFNQLLSKSNSYVYERVDVFIEDKNIGDLITLLSQGEVKMQLYGDKTLTYTISDERVKALQQTIDYYLSEKK
jgi:hypothetical protein